MGIACKSVADMPVYITGIVRSYIFYIKNIYNPYRPVARLGIEGGRDIFQVGPDMFVTLSKRFSKIF